MDRIYELSGFVITEVIHTDGIKVIKAQSVKTGAELSCLPTKFNTST
jgi:hypothetical protein